MTKKASVYGLILVVMTMLVLPVGLKPVSANSGIAPGSFIKGKSLSSVYYLGEDGKRYVFPNDRIYFSWQDDFSQVQTVSDSQLAEYQLGGNVQYKPGVNLVKIQTDPKVYAVSEKGLLRWIKTEALARALYGDNWNKMIDDIPDSFFFNYQIGTPISDDDEYDPDEEDAQITSISENLGLKIRKQIAHIIAEENRKTCDRLEKAIRKLQKRMRHFGIQLSNVGSDYLNRCAVYSSDKKVAICHVPPGNTAASTTIVVSKSAAEAHLSHGDTLGACVVSTHDKTAPVISNVAAVASSVSAVVTWTTNEPANSVVELAINHISSSTVVTSYIDNSATTSHSVSLSPLTPSTIYYFRVKSTDGSGNAALSAESSFVTTAASSVDTTAPVISAVSATPSTSTAAVSWTTNELSDSKVEYATSPLSSASTILSSVSSAMVVSHTLNLSSLMPSTLYYYRVTSKDASNNTATSSEQTFTTTALPLPDTTKPVISAINVSLNSTSATITWNTDEPATSKITYADQSLATATSTLNVSNAALVLGHSLDLTGLTASTTYYFMIESVDASSNTATSSEQSFATP